MEPRYKTLKEYVDACKNGSCNGEIRLDSWCMWAYDMNTNTKVLELHNVDLIEQALELLNLNFSHC